MSAKTERIVTELAGAIKTLGSSKTSPFDSTATIRRVEGSTAWVHFEGGEEETPAALTINAKAGDVVQVRVSDGRAFLVGNSSAPPTDDTAAIIADENAKIAYLAANDAIESAGKAADAAYSAQQSADEASSAAADASLAANNANQQASIATNHANNALTQLSTVENVIDTLAWIREHGTYELTTDTSVQPGKFYFTRSGEGTTADPYVYAVVTDPVGNPSTLGYYELSGVDEAVSNYVSTHLALTNEGLFITLDNSGYKLKLTNNGAYIIDPNGADVAAYSETTRIGNSAGNHVTVDSDSVDVKNGEMTYASFGETTIIGDQNGAHLEATADKLAFKDKDGNEIAYMAVDEDTNTSVFYMMQAIVVQDLFFGNWRWNSRANGNLALKWVGNEV